jgi:hypothetical protein
MPLQYPQGKEKSSNIIFSMSNRDDLCMCCVEYNAFQNVPFATKLDGLSAMINVDSWYNLCH